MSPHSQGGFHNSDEIAALLATDVPPNPRIEITSTGEFDLDPGNNVISFDAGVGDTAPAAIYQPKTDSPAASGLHLTGGVDSDGITKRKVWIHGPEWHLGFDPSDANSVGATFIERALFASDVLLNGGLRIGGWGSPDILTAFAAFTPTLGATITAPVMNAGNRNGFLIKLGRAVIWHASWAWTALGAGEGAGAGDYLFGVPTALSARYAFGDDAGSAKVFDASANEHNAGALVFDATHLQIVADATTIVGAAAPMAPANGDRYSISGIYEAAA